MADAEQKPRSPSGRVSSRLYLIVGALLIVLPLVGYFVSNWLTEKKKRVEEYFRAPVRELSADRDILCVAFSPDGGRVASGGTDRAVRIWKISGGRQEQKLAAHTQGVISVAFTPDGRRVLSSSYDGTIRVQDIAGGREVRRIEKLAKPIQHHFVGSWKIRTPAVAFSSDGERALVGDNRGLLRLLEIESGDELLRFGGGGTTCCATAISPDGRRGLSAGIGTKATLWSLEDGRRLADLSPSSWYSFVVVFSPDGRYALEGGNDGVRCWELAAVRLTEKFRGYRGDAWGIAFTPDGRRVLIGGTTAGYGPSQGILSLWDWESGRLIRSFALPQRECAGERNRNVYAVAISPDGRWAVSGGYWIDWISGGGVECGELYLWRLPDELDYWFLGTEETPSAGPRGPQGGGSVHDSRYPSR